MRLKLVHRKGDIISFTVKDKGKQFTTKGKLFGYDIQTPGIETCGFGMDGPKTFMQGGDIYITLHLGKIPKK